MCLKCMVYSNFTKTYSVCGKRGAYQILDSIKIKCTMLAIELSSSEVVVSSWSSFSSFFISMITWLIYWHDLLNVFLDIKKVNKLKQRKSYLV